MASEIRSATERERQLETRFQEYIHDATRNLVGLAEEQGFRVVYDEKEIETKSIKITCPDFLLEWDFDPRSLDSLGDFNPNSKLADACLYVGLVTRPYLQKKGLILPD